MSTERHAPWLARQPPLLVASAAISISIVGWVIVAAGLGDLRSAYLYRESTGEGLAMGWVAARLIAGGSVVLVGAAGLLVAAAGTSGRPRTVLFGVASSDVVALAACAAVSMWVALQSGCIGPCG